MENELIIDKIVSKIRCDNLTGRCFDDVCTDGYDTHIVLLAQEIFKVVKNELEKEI